MTLGNLNIALVIALMAISALAATAQEPSELAKARAAGLAFAQDRQFPADQLDRIQGRPDATKIALPGGIRHVAYTWKGEDKSKAWFVTVRISQAVTDAIVTAGRSDLAKPYKHLATARTAALAIAKAQKFPHDKIREVQGVPLSEAAYGSFLG